MSELNTRVPQVGEEAPDFRLADQNGDYYSLSDFRGDFNVIIAFYPGDFTPVCSVQIPNYKKDKEEFDKYRAVVLGISVDSVDCHKAWSKTFGGLNFPLLSDYFPHGEVANKFGVLSNHGYAKRGIFVVDKKGIIRYVDIHDIAQVPDNREIFKVLKEVEGKKGWL
ncbi:MAG: redoxin domain-containing protein [candidate division Zixibacteria bacterium]|nr:redoxin domain-containing protein [candidate division Zixibacteria bacterium]